MGRVFGWDGEGNRKVVGPTSSLSSPFKIQSLRIGEKIRVKSGKNIWTKLPHLFKHFRFFFFFFWLFLSLVTLGFFLFFFFSFFGFVRTWQVLLLFLFKFFFYYYFFKKTLLDDSLCYFLKCSLSSIHNFFF